MTPPARPRAQRARLTRTFLAAFFDNDLTASSHDRKETFIWTMGLLASPGFILPFVLAGASWGIVGRMTGFEVVRDMTRDYKIAYLAFAIVGPGIVCALMWSHLLVDRRDALVLGVLPVRPVTVTTAKLLAVLAYVAAVAAVMHVPAAVAFGGLLSTGSLWLAGVGAGAHFVASFLASATMFLAVTAAQALLVIAVGARRAPRWSSLVQVGLVGAVLWLIVTAPAVGADAMREMRGATAEFTAWGIRVNPPPPGEVLSLSPRLEASPPVWFFGIYESLIGAGQPVVPRMAMRGVMAFALMLGLTVALYPFACRRLLVGAVANPGGFSRTGRGAGVARALATVLTRNSTGRAAIQLLLASAGRLPRHRLVMAAAAGSALALAVPALLAPAPVEPRGWEAFRLLGLPFYVSTCLLVGLRLIVRTPGEVHAGWILAVADLSPHDITRALRRLFIVVGVVPWALLPVPFTWWLWGPALALTQAAFVLANGVLFATILLYRWSAMPCAERLGRLDQGRVGRQVLIWLLALSWLTVLPSALPILSQSPRGLTILLSLMGVATVAVALAHRHVDPLPREDRFAADTAFQMLGLD